MKVSLLALSLGMGAASIAAAQTVQERPALVVLIAIDQFRGDYLDRWAPQLTGGLARFRAQSALFPHAWQDHSNTETAPGHAAMLSGREPVHTEIITNGRGVPDPAAPLIGTSGAVASPRRFVGTTLYDWLVARDSDARVLSVSRKDRGAILTVGRAKGDVYWFNDGRFTTSRYYRDTLPSWVTAFDARISFTELAGSQWNLLLPPSSYSEPDSVELENGRTDYTFPHRLPSADSLKTRLEKYPWMDSLTLDFALAGVRATGVGKRALASRLANTMPDLVSISLSTTDAIGHAFGPDSREIHDQVLRVDRWLGAFMQNLEHEIPADRILYVLTADHGVSPMPEIARERTGRGWRLWLGDLAASVETALERRYHAEFGVEFDNGLFYADVAALRTRKVDVDSLSRSIADKATSRIGVRAAFTPTTLAESSDSAAVRWRRTLPPTLGWLAVLAADSDFVWSTGSIAEHGTPNALSLSVPIAFMGPGVAAGRYNRLVRAVDIAPTLAALIGIEPLETLDGAALREVRPTP